MTPEQFIRKVCHDLRAPLRALKDIPTWLDEDLRAHLDPLPDAVSELLEMQKTQAARLDLIVIGLSELAKLRRSEERPKTPSTDLWPGANSPEGLLRDIAMDHVPMEALHAKLVVKHLVDNAFKHGKAAQTSATLSIGGQHDGVRIAVTDFGPGIDPEFFEKVYEPLSTLKTRDECEGSGMGLAIIDQIAKLYGGTRAVYNNGDGLGLTSEIVVPLPQCVRTVET